MNNGVTDILPAVSGVYAPCVLYGSGNWRPGTDKGERTNQRLPSYALLAVKEGVHQIDTKSGVHRLDEGSSCLLEPGFPYVHRVAPGSRVLYVVFNVVSVPLEVDGDLLSTFALKLVHKEVQQPSPYDVWGTDLPTFLPQSISGLVMRELLAICDVWWQGQRGRFRANHHLTAILNALVTLCWSQNCIGEIDGRDPISKALALLIGRPPPSTVEEWAKSVGLHRSQFGRRFLADQNMPPGEYLRHVRLRRAEDLLRSTTESIGYVAQQAGYRNVSSLDHAFYAEHGCSPTVWRRRK